MLTQKPQNIPVVFAYSSQQRMTLCHFDSQWPFLLFLVLKGATKDVLGIKNTTQQFSLQNFSWGYTITELSGKLDQPDKFLCGSRK
jgi:hypothetical protein